MLALRSRPGRGVAESQLAGSHMVSFELNKIAGAVLGSLLFVMAIQLFAGAVFEHPRSAQPGWNIAVAERPAAGPASGAAAVVAPIAARLAKADPAGGPALFRQCTTCHTVEKGGPDRTGPNLWGVIGGPKAHAAGFGYSQAMRQKGANGEPWTFETLDEFIANPRAFVPGTIMGFAGLKNPDQRATLLSWMRTQSDNPVPLPPPP